MVTMVMPYVIPFYWRPASEQPQLLHIALHVHMGQRLHDHFVNLMLVIDGMPALSIIDFVPIHMQYNCSLTLCDICHQKMKASTVSFVYSIQNSVNACKIFP